MIEAGEGVGRAAGALRGPTAVLPAAEIMVVDREIGAVLVDLLTNPGNGATTRTRASAATATATEAL